MHLSWLLLALENEEKGAAPAMCSVSEAGSTDPLVTRFRQVEETLEKLHRENRSLKNKVPRYNAVCTLYHESAQQLKHLQLQLAAKEATIRELRGSLARQRQLPAPGGDAAAGAEPARSLVESLLEQLERARDQLRDSERLSARRVEALSQVKPRGRREGAASPRLSALLPQSAAQGAGTAGAAQEPALTAGRAERGFEPLRAMPAPSPGTQSHSPGWLQR